MKMNRRQQIRRVVLLCTHFARNMAYFRAGWDGSTLIRMEEFWKTINGNCLDIAVLEWCKLFADPKGAHHWSSVVTKPREFENRLLKEVDISDEDFTEYIKVVRTYRDKFVAHLDDELVLHPPPLDTGWAAVRFYYDHVFNVEAKTGDLVNLPTDLMGYFESSRTEAESHFLREQRDSRAENSDGLDE